MSLVVCNCALMMLSGETILVGSEPTEGNSWRGITHCNHPYNHRNLEYKLHSDTDLKSPLQGPQENEQMSVITVHRRGEIYG